MSAGRSHAADPEAGNVSTRRYPKHNEAESSPYTKKVVNHDSKAGLFRHFDNRNASLQSLSELMQSLVYYRKFTGSVHVL